MKDEERAGEVAGQVWPDQLNEVRWRRGVVRRVEMMKPKGCGRDGSPPQDAIAIAEAVLEVAVVEKLVFAADVLALACLWSRVGPSDQRNDRRGRGGVGRVGRRERERGEEGGGVTRVRTMHKVVKPLSRVLIAVGQRYLQKGIDVSAKGKQGSYQR
jgi:hypothetical protein